MPRILLLVVSVLSVPLTLIGCDMPNPTPITLAVVNAKVWTGDPSRPWAEAVAVSGDEIAAVGLGSEIRKMLGSATQVIDAHGKTVVPEGLYAEGRTEALQPGKLANFVILDRDLMRITPETVRGAAVTMTVTGGEVG